jgi:hypothetical protein
MGKEQCFIFDTGTDITSLDETAFADVKPSDSVVGADTLGGHVRLPTFEPPELTVGPFRLRDCGRAARMDFAPTRIATGMPAIGILGTSAYGQYILQFDYDQRRLRILRPDGAAHPEWGAAVPLEIERGCPYVRLQIGGREELFGIDSGYTGDGNFRTEVLDRVSSAATQPILSIPIAGATGWVQSRTLRYPRFDVEGLQYRDLRFGEVRSRHSGLGTGFIFRTLTTLDLPGRRLYLKPGKEFSRIDPNMTGMGVISVAGEVRAAAVQPKTPAYEGGIRDQDVLLEIDGQPTKGMTLSQAARMLRGAEGRVVTVKYRRGDEVRTAHITLRRVL